MHTNDIQILHSFVTQACSNGEAWYKARIGESARLNDRSEVLSMSTQTLWLIANQAERDEGYEGHNGMITLTSANDNTRRRDA